MTIGLISAPTNLGLRPPAPTSVPGTAKAPEALREAGLYRRFAERGARERGVVLPGRYADDAEPGVLRNQAAIVEHARRLAGRVEAVRADGLAPLVIGGDCSLLVGAGVALRRAPGRYGLVHLDGHTDFRHPGNSDQCASLAGEDLAAAVGLHWPAVADIDGLGPYFDPADTAHAGCRDDDTALAETTALLGTVVTAARIRRQGVPEATRLILDVVDRDGLDGYWLHLDVDILDPSVMPAVDSPDPGGLDAVELADLLAALAPRAIGAQVTVFDPDLDPDGSRARLLADVLVPGLEALGERR
ncbi:arginase family protein [Actinomadura montaniterrae]|uniref:arginase family protein n=1 Tax=Actinomadura montaniterrae TaxID=1803903 RepID=UPI001CEF84C4|nr:arginase family protein [Actinomadura montaniterrae]